MPRRPRRAVHTRNDTPARTPARTPTRYAIEALEPRTLFNTITGSGVFEYKDGRNNLVRVRFHNVQAELVFARVSGTTNEVVLGDATPAFDQVNDGKDLFTIYVAEAGPDSFITVAEVPGLMANVRPMMPFGGSVSLTIFGRGGIASVATDGGSIYLGARTRDTPANIANEADRPILTDNFSGLGILGPRPNGRLAAGIVVETGQDLSRFFWGGTISGQVAFGGSINTFYCGTLLTGDTRGQFGTPVLPNNFLVNGDIRELIVLGSIGTHADSNNGEPQYTSGFDMHVVGTIGRVQSYGSIIGNIRAMNDPIAPRLRGPQQEVEVKVRPRNRGSVTHFEGTDVDDLFFFDPDFVGLPRLGDNQGVFNNDTFETAQLLGVLDSKTLGANVINLNGRLQNIPQILDNIDYYGVALMAGQTINIRLNSPTPFFFGEQPGDLGAFIEGFLTVFDPDGRLVASDINNITPLDTLNQTFQFTADRPGTYRFAVNVLTNLLTNIDYQLQITNLGEMSIGAIAAADEIYGETSGQTQIQASRGDLGVIFTGSTLAYAGAPAPLDVADIFVDGGNLRAVDSAQIGFAQNDNGFGPNFAVTGGSVGLIRARTGLNNIETVVIKDRPDGLGGDLQLAEAPGSSLFIRLDADGGLGVLRASNMATDTPSTINVNTDDIGSDGIIDLIDVSGNFGTLGSGGPGITTGPGGNVRYIHVGGLTFRDAFFGGGGGDVAIFAPGEIVRLTDDSGTQMLLTPVPQRVVVNPDGTIDANPGSLSTIRYGIRDKGGVVLIRVGATRGLEVAAGGQNLRGTAEIGEIVSTSPGTPIIENEGQSTFSPLDDRLVLSTTTGENNELMFIGNAAIDVFDIGWSGAAANVGQFTRIINASGGEIVNMEINGVGELAAKSLGLAKSYTGTAVEGNTILAIPIVPVGPDPDAGPFSQQRNAIQVNGDVVLARANEGLGNFVVRGTIEQLIANADGKGTPGVHEGINGPILTQPGGVAEAGGGGIRHINIGEGILPSGSGEVQRSGIFAHGRIGEIINQGEGSDIRGDIVSKAQNLPPITRLLPNGTLDVTVPSPIGTIALFDGSILGSDIFVVDRFQSVREVNPGAIASPGVGLITTEPVFEIETVALNGKGGIMGTFIGAEDVGDVIVQNGFGIFNSAILSVGEGEVNTIVTDGYGIRTSEYRGGGSIKAIVAQGNGKRLATTNYTSSVRLSERMSFDPYTGLRLTGFNDLHRYLNTSKEAPIRTGGVSKSGVLYEFAAIGGRDLGEVHANQIKNSILSFATSTNKIIVSDYIDDLVVTSGRLDLVKTGNDIYSSEFNISGPIGTIGVGGTFRGSSRVSANGPNGQIGVFATGRSLYGAVISANDIGEIRVGTDFGGAGAINEDGDKISAGIDAGGNLHNFIVKGSLLAGSTVFVDDKLGFFSLGGDVQEGATVSVESVGSQQITGQVFGDFIVRG